MSKERRRRREAREREAAIKAAARAAEQERRDRAAARRRAVRSVLPAAGPRRPVGIRARRARRQWLLLLALVAAGNLLVWFMTPEWPVRALLLVVSLLATPVLHTLLFRSR